MVTSNEELFTNIVRNGSLWINVVFERAGVSTKIFEFDFEISEFDFKVSKVSIWKHTTSSDQGVFTHIIISQLRRYKFVILCICWDKHQVRRQVLDNYQRCPVSLLSKTQIKKGRVMWFILLTSCKKNLTLWKMFPFESDINLIPSNQSQNGTIRVMVFFGWKIVTTQLLFVPFFLNW